MEWLRVLACSACLVGSAPGWAATRAILADFESPAPVFASGQEAGAGCRVELSTEQAHSGQHAVKITYDYVDKPGIQYEALGTELPMAGHVSAVSGWFFGNGSGLPVVLRVTDSGGEVHQFRWGQLDLTGWRELTAELKDPLVIYGGDGNQRMDWPIRLTQIIIDRGPLPAKGAVYVDDLTYVTDASPADFVTATVTGTEPGNVYVLGKRPPKVTVEVRNGSAEASVEGNLAVVLRGPDGGEVAREARACHLGPGERLAPAALAINPSRAGLFGLTVTLSANGERTLASTRVCVLPDEGDGKLDPTSPFAACTHFGQGKGRLTDSFELLARAGIKWLRDECGWGGVEQKKGVYTFPESVEAFLRAAKEHGITPLMILDYGNGLYDNGAGPNSDVAQAAFGEYCFQMVSHFKGLCRHWEVYNEPNIGFWQPKPDPAAYARLLKIAYAACKRADPECTVVGICTAGTDLNFIRTVLQQSGSQYLDALSIHPYRYPSSPEASNFVREVTGAQKLLTEFGGGTKKVWLTELGWPTHEGPGGVTEDVSARMLVRMYTQALSLPFTGPVVWYDFQNDGLDVHYNENNFGLIRWDDFSAKAGYLAYRMMTRALAGKAFREQLRLTDGVYAYVFGAGAETTIVAWYVPADEGKAPEAKQSVAFRVDAKEVELSRITGETERVPVTGGSLPVTLGPSPIFLRGRFREARAAKAPLGIKLEQTADVRPGVSITGSWEARGLVGRELQPIVPVGWRVTPESWKPTSDDDHAAFRVLVPLTAQPGSSAVGLATRPMPGSPEAELVASTGLSVGPALDHTFRFSSASGSLGLHWTVRNRSAVDLHEVSHTLTAPGVPPGCPETAGLARGARLERGLELSAPPAGPAAREAVHARFTCAEGLAVDLDMPVNVWRVPRAQEPIAPNGNLDKWPDLPVSLPLAAEAVPIESALAPGRFATIEGQSWSGPQDLSARIGLRYDEARLYLAADVVDDQHVQPETGSEVWKGDGIQLAVDFDPERTVPPGKRRYEPCELGLTLGKSGPEVYRWLPFGGSVEAGPLTGRVGLAVTRRGTHTVYEAAVPWEALLPPANWRAPKPGGASSVLGFALVINDNDGSGRKGWLQLFGGIGYGKDPSQYGQLILAD